MIDNDAIKKVCTEKQWAALQAYRKHRSERKAAAELGISKSSLRKHLQLIKVKLENLNPSIENTVQLMASNPDITGVSDMQQNEHGKPMWVKYNKKDASKIRAMQEFADGLKESLPKQQPLSAQPKCTSSDLLTQYTITDYHLGMLADAEETGGKWNIKLAEQMLLDWFAATMAMAPDSEQAVYMQIGDFLHWDGLKAITPAHGHVLDADTRYQKLIRSCIRVTRQIVNMLLDKHARVHLIFAEGNHDESGSGWMREFLDVFYEDEPRITIDTSIDPYYGYKFGNNGIFAHHGHKKKMEALPQVFAAKFREIMFSCKYNYGHTGHLHHSKVIESPLMIMMQHQTMSAPDAHASSGGWLSQRGAKATIYHKEHGYMTEYNTTPAMLGYEDAPRKIYTLD